MPCCAESAHNFMTMKKGIIFTLFSFFILQFVPVVFISSVSAQPFLSEIESTDLEYIAGDGQVSVTSTIRVDARFYLYSATIRISSGYVQSEDRLIYTGTYSNIRSSWDNNSGTITLTGFASETRYRTALRNIKYENTNTSGPSAGTRVVSFTVSDNASSNTVSRNIKVSDKNSPPVIGNIETEPAIFCMNSGSFAITQTLILNDADDSELVSASVSISTGYTPENDRLVFTNQNGITGNWNSNSGQLTLSGPATLEQYQQALRSVRYENLNPERPHSGYHDITFLVNDGDLLSNTMSRTLIYSVPSATLSGSHSICRGDEAPLQVTFTGTAPWSLSYIRNNEAPLRMQNISANPLILPAFEEGTYTLTEVSDKYCPGSVSGGASVDILPEPTVSITGLSPIYSRQSTEMVPLIGLPGGGSFSGPGVIQYDQDWFLYPTLLPVGVHQIVYKYRVDAASCYGYDTATVKIIEKSAAIEIAGNRQQFCRNDNPFTITGINLINNNPGSFTISGGKGLSDHGNNTATVYPDSMASNAYTIIYTASGGIEASEVIEIGDALIANFNWNAECFEDGEPITFNNASVSPFGFLGSDSYRWTVYNGSDSLGFSTKDITYTFPEPGDYSVKLSVQNSFGCRNSISKVLPLRPVFVLAENIYSDDLEEESYWKDGFNPEAGISSWQLGRPDRILNGFSGPSSGDNCWYTNLTINPAPREESWITSPCFDFRGTEKPTLVAKIWRSFTDDRDGANMSYTTDNGLHWSPIGNVNDGINWFNDYFGTPGSQLQGWTDITDREWLETRHILDFLKDEPLVQFRFNYVASGSAIGNKGIAVDDIKIVERNRTILIEHFTNMSEKSSAADNMLDNLASLSGPNVIDLQYHTSDSLDPFYLQNPVIPDARQFYYGLNVIPFSVINGGSLSTQQIDYVNTILSSAQIGIESLYDSEFNLKLTTMQDGNRLYAETIVTSVQDIPLTELSVRIAVIEPLIVESQASGEDSIFRNVVRAMLPNAAGNSLHKPWQKGETYRIVEWWDIANILNPQGLKVVAFIQNEETRVIHQAAIDTRGIVNALDESSANGIPELKIFPNPADDNLHIDFSTTDPGSYRIDLLNSVGAAVYSQRVSAMMHHIIKVSNLPQGVYLLRVTSDFNRTEIRKIVITH